jgi:hypothetical protein
MGRLKKEQKKPQNSRQQDVHLWLFILSLMVVALLRCEMRMLTLTAVSSTTILR